MTGVEGRRGDIAVVVHSPTDIAVTVVTHCSHSGIIRAVRDAQGRPMRMPEKDRPNAFIVPKARIDVRAAMKSAKSHPGTFGSLDEAKQMLRAYLLDGAS